MDSVHLPASNYPRVCFANLIPLIFPHDVVHVITCLYSFDPSLRFTIQVTHGLVEHVCVRGVMDVVFSVCIVTRGALGACVWEVCAFRHADVVCLCLLCILWQFSVQHYA